jgi:hypothetical protein
MRAHPADVRTPHLAGVCALSTWVRAPLRRARPSPGKRVRPTCAPLLAGVRVPPRKRVRLIHMGVRPPPRRRARPTPADMRPPLIAGVRSLPRRRARPPPCWRAHPTPLACAPSNSRACPPEGMRALPTWVHAPHRRARPPPRRRAHPTPIGVRAIPTPVRGPLQTCAPCPQLCAPCPPQCTRPHRWWQNKIYKEGSLTSPLHHAWLCALGLLCGLLA